MLDKLQEHQSEDQILNYHFNRCNVFPKLNNI